MQYCYMNHRLASDHSYTEILTRFKIFSLNTCDCVFPPPPLSLPHQGESRFEKVQNQIWPTQISMCLYNQFHIQKTRNCFDQVELSKIGPTNCPSKSHFHLIKCLYFLMKITIFTKYLIKYQTKISKYSIKPF